MPKTNERILFMKAKWSALIIAVIMIISMLAGCGTSNDSGEANGTENTKNPVVTFDNMMENWKKENKSNSVSCWYTDSGDQRWLAQKALDFEKEYGIKVDIIYYDGAQLFGDINQANQNGTGPDMYIMGNDRLEYAVTGGMIEENKAFDDAFWQENYPATARSAFNYKGKQYGYPVYFDTYCLVYDANLLENAPASIDDILAFLDEYEDTGSTKAVFRWDVADPYINSMFIASYADIFGENGDDINSFSVNGEQEVKAMEYFQSLSAYLWMDKTNISHDTVMNRIKEGTLVLGLCKSDILPILYEMQGGNDVNTGDNEGGETDEAVAAEGNESEETGEAVAAEGNEGEETGETVAEEGNEGGETGDAAAEEGNEGGETGDGNSSSESETNYKVAYVPSLTAELSSTCFSTTYGACINPYGNNQAAANMFSLYLAYEDQDRQFAGNGKLPVINQKYHFDEMQTIMYAQYQNSKPVPKTMLLGDYLIEGGIVFDAIWEGGNAKEQLDHLQSVMEEKIK